MVMTPEPPVPTIDGMPITAVRTKHWYKADGEPNHLPTLTGAAGWDIAPTGVASARLWAVTWTAGATPPRGVRKNWREYDLTNIVMEYFTPVMPVEAPPQAPAVAAAAAAAAAN